MNLYVKYPRDTIIIIIINEIYIVQVRNVVKIQMVTDDDKTRIHIACMKTMIDWRFPIKGYPNKVRKTHLFQQKNYTGIVTIYFKCGFFIKVVEK